MRIKKQTIIVAALIDLSVVILITYLYFNGLPLTPQNVLAGKLPVYTKADLMQYNGVNPKLPIYIGLDGYVYDVSSSRNIYGPGGHYHTLAGTDTTSPLMEMFGAKTVREKYKVIGILK